MQEIFARERKGHHILAVERFQDSPRWMIAFVVCEQNNPYGSLDDEMRLFLREEEYQRALISQNRREIHIKRTARIIEGHILYDKKKQNNTNLPLFERNSDFLCQSADERSDFNGCFSRRKDKELHCHVKLSFERSEPDPESQRTIVHDAVSPG